MSNGITVEDFQDLTYGDWEADILNTDHIIFVKKEFPIQIDVMRDHYDDGQAWHISLYVYNPQQEVMDLLSGEYSTILPSHDGEGVREEIAAYMDAVESGDLDTYRTNLAS